MAILGYQEFLNNTTRILSDPTRTERTIAAIVIDFDGLAELDGILGYHHVDRLLQQAAKRVVEACHDTDLVGCIGRHQLVCLFPNLPGKGYAELAGHKLLRILSLPFSDDGRRLIISARIGIALADTTNDVQELLRQANSAMHQAEREHEIVKIYAPDIDALILSELELLSDFDRAIEESRIFIVYQPHLALASGRIVGAEALLRWNHPQKAARFPLVV